MRHFLKKYLRTSFEIHLNIEQNKALVRCNRFSRSYSNNLMDDIRLFFKYFNAQLYIQ